MGKAGRNEMKRVGANFLNGTAVAVVTAGCVLPILQYAAAPWAAVVAMIAGATLHKLALLLVVDMED